MDVSLLHCFIMEERAWGIYQPVSKKEPTSIFNQEGHWLRASSSVESLNTPLASEQCFLSNRSRTFPERHGCFIGGGKKKTNLTRLPPHSPGAAVFVPHASRIHNEDDIAEMLSQGQDVRYFLPPFTKANNGYCVYRRNKGREFFQPLSRRGLVSRWGGNRMLVAPPRPRESDWTKWSRISLKVLLMCCFLEPHYLGRNFY